MLHLGGAQKYIPRTGFLKKKLTLQESCFHKHSEFSHESMPGLWSDYGPFLIKWNLNTCLFGKKLS